jgi:hypothetical protein
MNWKGVKMKFESAYELAEHYRSLINAVPYPEKVNLPPKPVRGNFPNNKSFGEALDEWEDVEGMEKTIRNRKLQEHRQAVSNIEEEFKVALFDYLGISKNKKAEKLYSMAWENGHASGYTEVAQIAEQLAELIR